VPPLLERSYDDCKPLISKLPVLTPRWASKGLLLENSVGFLQDTWYAKLLVPVFVISSKVIRGRAEMLCISKGKEGFRLQGQVSWKSVTLPKQGGRLGRKKCCSVTLPKQKVDWPLSRSDVWCDFFVVLACDFTVKSLCDHIREKQVRVDFLP
jgi:hypothetical protein